MADSSLAEGRFKFFLGATEWGPGQLKEEIEAGAWLVLDCDAELVGSRRPNPIAKPMHSQPPPSPPPSPPTLTRTRSLTLTLTLTLTR